MTPHAQYLTLMQTIRGRLDIIAQLRTGPGDEFLRAESAAFHARKVVEGIAFGCLTAIEQTFKEVPSDAKGQWNAEVILKGLEKKGLSAIPSPSVIRVATAAEVQDQGVRIAVEGVPERRLSVTELIAMYQELHGWLHEANPYTKGSFADFYAKRGPALWTNLGRLEAFIERHFIAIQGQGFFCVLRDNQDGLTKVIALSKPS